MMGLSSQQQEVHDMAKSTINLKIDFTATGDTEPLPADVIAELVKRYIEVQMDAAEVKVTVQGSFLSYVEAYEGRKAQVEQQRKDALS
jgi:hypothetical protein